MSGELVNGWITDVTAQTTIRSIWGNQIRDRVVMQYASIAERNAASNAGHAVVGELAWATAEKTLAVWSPTWVVLYQPAQTYGAVIFLDNVQGVPTTTYVAEWNRVGENIRVRTDVAIDNPAAVPGIYYVSLPVQNRGPEPEPVGTAYLFNYSTGQGRPATAFAEFGRVWFMYPDSTRAGGGTTASYRFQFNAAYPASSASLLEEPA